MAYLALVLRLALAWVFLVSGATKARAVADTVDVFAELIGRLMPDTLRNRSAMLSRVGAWALIVAELVCGLLLLVGGVLSSIGLVGAIALLAAFTVLAVVSARSTLNLQCACFGRATTPLGWRHVYRNGALIVLAAVGLAAHLADGDGSLEPAGVALAVTAAAVVATLTAFYDDIVDLFGDNVAASATRPNSPRT